MKRDVVAVDLDLAAALRRRAAHPDPVSRRGNALEVDKLLDGAPRAGAATALRWG